MIKKISKGTDAHDIPLDITEALSTSVGSINAWESLSPLARNEWICWCVTVKQTQTRQKHIERMLTELKQGKRRPCCWMGCPHRTDKAVNPTQKWILEKNNKSKVAK
jgi:hypothetical protein